MRCSANEGITLEIDTLRGTGSKMRLLLTILYPFASAAFPVFLCYSMNANISEPLNIMFLPLAMTISICLMLLSLGVICLRSLPKAALLTSTFFLAAFVPLYCALLFALLSCLGLPALFLINPTVFLTAALIVLCCGVAGVVGPESLRNGITRVWQTFSLYSLALELLAIGLGVGLLSTMLIMESLKVSQPTATVAVSKQYPNFYYVILDGYANPETWKERFDYDNAAFIAALSAAGFRTAEDSFANYGITELSLCSSLNMDYLENIANISKGPSDNLSVACWYLQDNRILRLLSGFGYKYVHLGSVFGPTEWNFLAQKNMPAGMIDMFSIYMYQMSVPGIMDRVFKWNICTRLYTKSMKNSLSNLEKTGTIKGPKFVFAHLMLTHPPFVFTAEGKQRPYEGLSFDWPNSSKQAYLEQAKFAEVAVLATLKRIVAIDPDAIIVLQSDHGPAFEQQKDEDRNTYLYHRMRIFNAFKMPSTIRLLPQMSPVNTFRYLFGKTLPCRLPLHENKSLLSSYAKPYEYTDVTPLYLESHPEQQKTIRKSLENSASHKK